MIIALLGVDKLPGHQFLILRFSEALGLIKPIIEKMKHYRRVMFTGLEISEEE